MQRHLLPFVLSLAAGLPSLAAGLPSLATGLPSLATGLAAQPVVSQTRPSKADMAAAERAAVQAWKRYQGRIVDQHEADAPMARQLRAAFQDYADALSAGEDVSGLRKRLQLLHAESAALHKGYTKLADEALGSFHASFLESNWQAYDVTRHGDLLRNGLMYAGRRCLHREPGKAVSAYCLFLKLFPGQYEARRVRGKYLPTALVAAGRIEEARNHVDRALKEVDTHSGLYVILGDLAAIEWRFEEATRLWRKAGVDTEARLRLRLVHQEAPDIDAHDWVGADANPLLREQAGVTVLCFCATGCQMSRAALRGLNKMQEDHAGEGLRVLAVTRVQEKGYLPRCKRELCTGGEPVQDLTKDTFPSHLARFRARSGLEFPIVIASHADFFEYGVHGTPTMVVVDTKGRVTFVASGELRVPMVHAAVSRALAAAADN